jgi:hypothetical protein
VPYHTAAYQLHDQQRTRTSDKWYESLVRMVETCESDPKFGRRFKLSTSDKRDLYERWQILAEQRAGNTASVIELIDRLMESPECTSETIDFLVLQGLIPRTGQYAVKRRHPNHRTPDFNWYLDRSAARAVA